MSGGRFSTAARGKGANQALAAARLGADVTFLAKVGRDAFGNEAIAQYQREEINTDWVRRDDELPTGVALIVVNERGENQISVASGANDALRPADIERAAELFNHIDMLLAQLEIPLDTVACAIRLAHRAGVQVLLDPAPAPVAPLESDLLAMVDYIKPNQHEAEQLTGIAIASPAEAIEAATALLARGTGAAVVTVGAGGACWAERGAVGVVNTGHVSGIAVQAVDTTAAGDAVSAALAAELASGATLLEAVRFADLAGALSATRAGAQPSLPTRDEIARFAARLQ